MKDIMNEIIDYDLKERSKTIGYDRFSKMKPKPFTPSWKFRSTYCEECRKITKQYLTSSDNLVCNNCKPRSPKKIYTY